MDVYFYWNVFFYFIIIMNFFYHIRFLWQSFINILLYYVEVKQNHLRVLNIIFNSLLIKFLSMYIYNL